jgi:hypothetical protein
MDLLNLPIDSIDRLIGDMLTDTIPQIIISTYDGNPEPLFALLKNQETDWIVPFMIANSLSGLIFQNMIDKETVILRIKEIVASGKMNNNKSFYTAIEILTSERKLEPLYDIVRAAFKAGMIIEHDYGLNEFEKQLLVPIEKLENIRNLSPITHGLDELNRWNDYDTPLAIKIERNAPCPCGSQSKFKKCCINML